MRISWPSSRVTIPRTVWRVVCGFDEAMAIFCPTSAFVSVDLPAFGRPTKHAKPERWVLSFCVIVRFLFCCFLVELFFGQQSYEHRTDLVTPTDRSVGNHLDALMDRA